MKTIIIDDEPDSIGLLQLRLKQHFPQVHVMATFTSPVEALRNLESLQPQLVFLDIEMPVMNGFELLSRLIKTDFSIIFVTAYNQFAIKAFKFNALDYLVKPVNVEDLSIAISKAESQQRVRTEQVGHLYQQLQQGCITKIAVPGNNGVVFIDFNDIICIEASNNYSTLILKDNKKVLVAKTLKDVQEVMEQQHFLRVHRQYIINLNQVKGFNRNEGLITLSNNTAIPVSRNQKDLFMSKYGWL